MATITTSTIGALLEWLPILHVHPSCSLNHSARLLFPVKAELCAQASLESARSVS